MLIRKPYEEYESDSLICNTPSLTRQSAKDECDINQIVKKHLAGQVSSFVNKNEPRYEDYTGFDFQAAMNTVASASEMFADLPAVIRKRFQNDPVEFMNFVHDPENIEEGRKLGIFSPAKPPVTVPPGTEPVVDPGQPTVDQPAAP